MRFTLRSLWRANRCTSQPLITLWRHHALLILQGLHGALLHSSYALLLFSLHVSIFLAILVLGLGTWTEADGGE